MIHRHSNEPEPKTGILLYLHCKKCLQEKPSNISPAQYQQTQSGISPEGNLIVWCLRHDILVCLLSGSESMRQLVGAGCQKES